MSTATLRLHVAPGGRLTEGDDRGDLDIRRGHDGRVTVTRVDPFYPMQPPVEVRLDGAPFIDVGLGISVERRLLAGRELLDVTTSTEKLRFEIGPKGLTEVAHVATGLGRAAGLIGELDGFRLTRTSTAQEVVA